MPRYVLTSTGNQSPAPAGTWVDDASADAALAATLTAFDPS